MKAGFCHVIYVHCNKNNETRLVIFSPCALLMQVMPAPLYWLTISIKIETISGIEMYVEHCTKSAFCCINQTFTFTNRSNDRSTTAAFVNLHLNGLGNLDSVSLPSRSLRWWGGYHSSYCGPPAQRSLLWCWQALPMRIACSGVVAKHLLCALVVKQQINSWRCRNLFIVQVNFL